MTTVLNSKRTRDSSELRQIKKQKKSQQKGRSLLDLRQQLPIYEAKQTILALIKDNQVTVIEGETGSGKTTQIPQFLYESGYAKSGIIGITQPRRVAALSLAQRVSDELNVKLGTTVGYTIRFDDTTSGTTKIKYLTDGMLLREALIDPMLSKYSVIVLDEAHERTLRTDILFGIVKRLIHQRNDLKVVVMSATLDTDKFSSFFNGAKILKIPGRLHGVSVFHTESPQQDYLHSSLMAVFQIHREGAPGDILCFLTGQEDIESLTVLITEFSKQLAPTQEQLLVCPIFANLPASQQSQVFKPAPKGYRKVVLATNIAETSITISGIRYVIDSGLVKERLYSPKIAIDSLTVQPISQSSARQRMGRAGREAEGHCYRLYTEKAYEALQKNSVPEIKRCNLAGAILLLKAVGIQDILRFDFMDKPDRDSLIGALEQLLALGALDDRGELSPLGKQMSSYPVDPTLAKMLIAALDYSCTQDMIAVISLLSVDTIFFTPNDKKEEAVEMRKKFMHSDGDILTWLNVLKGYEDVNGDAEWCRKNFINVRNLKQVLAIRTQLTNHLVRQNIPLNSSFSTSTTPILLSLLSGLFMNVAILQPDNTYKTLIGNHTVHIHPSSALFGKRHKCLCYTELVLTSRVYMRGISVVELGWIEKASPGYFGRLKTAKNVTKHITKQSGVSS